MYTINCTGPKFFANRSIYHNAEENIILSDYPVEENKLHNRNKDRQNHKKESQDRITRQNQEPTVKLTDRQTSHLIETTISA